MSDLIQLLDSHSRVLYSPERKQVAENAKLIVRPNGAASSAGIGRLSSGKSEEAKHFPRERAGELFAEAAASGQET